jgi:hypothetical protein
VHTPEFSFEHDAEGVRRAVAERAIDYPVAIDNEYAVWGAFANLAWPALYFVDRDGAIRDQHYGEGRYAASERVIQELLGVERDLTRVDGGGVEAAADWEHLGTPETYLGYDRGLGPSGAPLARLGLNQWALDGAWAIEAERVVLTQAAGTIAFRFRARDVHLVLDRAATGPIPWRVRLDGEAPGPSAGVDADADGHGVLDAGRMYQLVRLRDGVEDEHTIEITFLAAGAQAYSFTFG